MNIYTVSGLGADERVFKHLKLDHTIIPVKWIKPTPNETINSYSKRISSQIKTTKPFVIMGVSFGGIIAVELSKIHKPLKTILISSFPTSHSIRSSHKAISYLGVLKLLPIKLFDLPRPIAHKLFGAKNKTLLNEILDDTDLSFTKWALNQIPKWKSKHLIENLYIVHGDNDKLVKAPSQIPNTTLIKNGGHFMIVDKAQEISTVINKQLKS